MLLYLIIHQYCYTLKWLLFFLLSIIWGSSFVLMKEGLAHLSAYQVASIRIVASGLVLIPYLIKAMRNIPIRIWHLVFFSGMLGSLLPAYLFCIAETGIDSAFAGALNSLTPIFTILTGVLFFNLEISSQKITGILVAFAGCIILFLSQQQLSLGNNLLLTLPIIIATLCYGLNVNLVQKHLKGIASLEIVSLAMFLNAIPAFIMLIFSGYFSLSLAENGVLHSSLYAALLGIGGTSLANILFYILIKKAGSIFSSMVTYGIPFVALAWGILYHEQVGWGQVLGLSVILLGVYLASMKFPKKV